MFDLAWSEIAVIGVVALIAIGPKDLPIAIKAVAEMVKKGRRMASEFQGHVDEMVREANLHEVRDQINELRTMDVKGRILNAVDNDGSLRRTIHDDPLKPDPFTSPGTSTPAAAPDVSPAAAPVAEAAAVPGVAPSTAAIGSPGLPPETLPPEPLHPEPLHPPAAAPHPVAAQRDQAAEPLPIRS